MARRSMLIFVHSLSMPIVTFSSALGNLDSGIWYCSLSYHFWSDYGLVCNTSTVQAPSCRVLSRGDNSPVQLTPCQQHRIAVLYMLWWGWKTSRATPSKCYADSCTCSVVGAPAPFQLDHSSLTRLWIFRCKLRINPFWDSKLRNALASIYGVRSLKDAWALKFSEMVLNQSGLNAPPEWRWNFRLS